jgi:ATP/ADP translocase
MIKAAWENYKRPTPEKWRKIGDSINALGNTLQVVLASYAASGNAINNYFAWVITIAFITWSGSTIVNFAKEDTL